VLQAQVSVVEGAAIADFPPAYSPQQPSLVRLLHQRTGGNPLFLVSTVEELVDQGILTQTDYSWSLQGEVADVGIAESIRHLVARQWGRLSTDERQTLEAACVAGMEFSAAAVAAALVSETPMVERQCEQLAERHQFLCRVGIEAGAECPTHLRTLDFATGKRTVVQHPLWDRPNPFYFQGSERHGKNVFQLIVKHDLVSFQIAYLTDGDGWVVLLANELLRYADAADKRERDTSLQRLYELGQIPLGRLQQQMEVVG
jgi:hypothetical protein